MASNVRLILVTKTGCGPCGQFLTRSWPSLKEPLSFGIGGKPVEHIDISQGYAQLPPAVRPSLQFVPQIFALYGDGKIETPKNPLTRPEGIGELQEWAKFGPPRYAASMDSEPEYTDDSVYEVVAITSTGCPHCAVWEASGDLQKFLDSIPAPYSKSRFNVDAQEPKSNEDAARRMALMGIRVPTAIVVNRAKWQNPLSQNLQKRDVMLSPGLVNTPNGLIVFRKWLSMMKDDKTPFLGYLLLETSSTCGHCQRWKEEGGMARFIETNKNIPGILLVHNGTVPMVIKQNITSVPSVFFVPASEWSSPNPEVAPGPDPRDEQGMQLWVEGLLRDEGKWSNDPNYMPPEYEAAAASRRPKASRALTKRRPLERQRIR